MVYVCVTVVQKKKMGNYCKASSVISLGTAL